MEQGLHLSARWDLEQVRIYLNRLDRAAEQHHGPNLRAWQRLPYRTRRLPVDVLDDDRAVGARYVSAGRNLSRGGVAFLNGRLIYPGTRCRVQLAGPHQHEQIVDGRITRCHYVLGSGSLYDVGVRFEHLIDLSVFAPRARHLRILLADADDALPELVRGFLGDMSVDVRSDVTTPSELLQTIVAEDFHLLLIDLEDQRWDALRVASQLRSLGYVGPIVGLAVQVTDELHQRCAEMGCTGYLRKPITRASLRRLIHALMDKPLVSTLAHDRTLTPLIDRFVRGLPERTRALAGAYESDQLDQLDRVARTLRGEAGSYGFEPITEAAAELQTLIAADESDEHIQRALHHLIHLCLTARPATCIEPPAPAKRGAR